ncbi:MAG: D-tyrosyl-tRNA(Tyr) deacylase [Deltaproteobacteria bacterium]|nr:D-tyrosyl-tRNA(Tyr) deacylase [Deltaproteobacteria bacterium]MBW2041688.1 D-tyrosyl-tRNA(Tyr) deacylase [Deltaproteobacteria bacterium]MBW2131750.1 D-tyrosyl-tRNA(Tyr) deacylase [Deltaproteobacteria bacterium]
MRAVVQRVKECTVVVKGESVGSIEKGLLVFLGVHREDTPADAEYLAQKIASLRIFEDDTGKMNRSLVEVAGSILVVSQFTLYGDCRKGRRPSFIDAAPPDLAQTLYDHFVELLRKIGVPVETGWFQAMMEVTLVNDGPVTLILESPQ